MKVTTHEQALIHEVMLMAYEQGIEEGYRRAIKTMHDAADLRHPTIDDLPDGEDEE